MIAKKNGSAEASFRKAQDSTAKGDLRRGFSHLLEALKQDPQHGESLAAAAKAAELLGDSTGSTLFEALNRSIENPKHLYALGYHLIGMGRPDVSVSLLEKCLELSPNSDDVRYELGYSLFLTRSYTAAIDQLTRATENLNPERAAAAELLQIECLLLLGRLDNAEERIGLLRDELTSRDREDSLEALELMASRLRSLDGDNQPAGARMWHFIQHGGVLLAESRAEGSHGRFQSLVMNAAAVGAMLRLLKTFVHGMGIIPEAILTLGGDGYPLALAAGRILDRPVRPFEDRRGTGELLVVDDTDTLPALDRELRDRESLEWLFCFRMNPALDSAILPDMAGLMAHSFRFYWQERVEVAMKDNNEPYGRSVPADPRPPEDIAREIAEQGAALPEDAKMAAVVDFFRKRRSLVVAANRESFPLRRAFTSFSPILTSTGKW